MSSSPPSVDQFVTQVNRRINRYRTRNIAIWATLIGGAIMLAVAIFFVLPGYRVPWMLYPCVFLTAFLCAVVAVLVKRFSKTEAASFADRFFDLKDSVGSCLAFDRSGKRGGFYELQAAQTQRLIENVSLERLAYQPPWRPIAIATLLVAVSVSLGFKSVSPEIEEQRKQEQNTLSMTIEANEQIKELVDQLEKSSDDEHERKLLKPDKLREWVDELKETTDLHEAKRQYSKMEMRLNRAADALRQRREEKLLDQAAEELKLDLHSVDLSKDLKHKKYEQAAEKLEKFKPDQKNIDFKSQSKLSQARKDLAKLKAVAKRMSAAARKTQGSWQGQRNRPEESDGDDSKGERSVTDDSQNDDEGDLSELIEELDEAVDDLDRQLEEIELSDLEDGEEPQWSDEELDGAGRTVRSKMDELNDRMKRMAGRRRARSKLKRLSKKMAQYQSSSRSRQPGGIKPGKHDGELTRDEEDERIDNGQNTKLKGLKGSGPSQTQLQAADDGDGTSQRRSKATSREFQRQYESFVDREDIPEDLKSGVKEYFINIHRAENAKSNDAAQSTNLKQAP